MRKPITAPWRLRIRIPTVNDILQNIQRAASFTELSLSQGYPQESYPPVSRFITAFSTPKDGSHQLRRLVIGACPSSKYLYKKTHELEREEYLWQQHGQPIALLERHGYYSEAPRNTAQYLANEWFNPRALQMLLCATWNVFGHIVSADGKRLDPRKIEAITQAPLPKCAFEIPYL